MTPEFTAALGGIAAIPQFFIWRLTWEAVKGKYAKHPIHHPSVSHAASAGDPDLWMDYQTACTRLHEWRAMEPGGMFTLGWYFTADTGYWFLDLDGVVGTDGTWAPKALEWYGQLPGVMFEYSSSGKGAHLIGRGRLPEHRKKPPEEWKKRPDAIDCELYHEKRGIAFGLTGAAWGCADVAADTGILGILHDAFPPRPGGESDEKGRWDHGPRSDWSGPSDDDELIAMACKSTSILARLGGKASFAQLWQNDPAAAKFYSGTSEMDAAMAMHLAFWTGCDAVRIERIMRRSCLARPKWDEHRTYLKELTIETACDRQQRVFSQGGAVQQLYAPTTILPPGDNAQGITELITPDQVAALESAMSLATSATSDIDMHNRVIPAVRNMGLPGALMVRVANTINRMLGTWDAKLPMAQLRALLGNVDVVKTQTVDELRPAWVDDYVYLSNPDKFLERGSGQLLSGLALHRKLARQPAVPTTAAGTKMDVARLFTEQWNVMQAHDSAYHAGMPAVFMHKGRHVVNTFHPASMPLPAPAIEAAAMPGILAFCAHLDRICKGERGAKDVLLQWMAWQVQRIGQKVRWMPLIIGIEGSGKSIFHLIMRTLVGDRNVSSVTNSAICNSGGFTDWAEGAAVMMLEEVHMAGASKYLLWNTAKPFVTNDEAYINRKGRAGCEVLNGSNHFAFSNYQDALPLKKDDRRVFVIKTPYSDMQAMWDAAGVSSDKEYFDVIYDSIERYGSSWVRWFRDLQIPESFDPRRAPMTHAKMRMVGLGREELEDVAIGLLDDGAPGLGYMKWGFSTLHLQGALVMRGLKPQTNTVHYLYSKMGYSKIGQCRSGNSWTSIWVRPEFVEESPTELYKRLMKL